MDPPKRKRDGVDMGLEKSGSLRLCSPRPSTMWGPQSGNKNKEREGGKENTIPGQVSCVRYRMYTATNYLLSLFLCPLEIIFVF